MSMIYGYCRVSTKTQSIDRQTINIKKLYPEAIIFSEAFTGTKLDRPEFSKLLKIVKPGDTIVFDSVSRMSRNAEEGMAQYEEFMDQGIELVFLKEPHINTQTYKATAQSQIGTVDWTTGDADANKMLNQISGAIFDYIKALARRQIVLAFEQSQKEVDDLHQRTSEGMAAKGATSVRDADGNIIIQGKISKAKTGKRVITKKGIEIRRVILKHAKAFGGTLSDKECIAMCQVDPHTFYKYKKQLLAKEYGTW